MPVHRFQHSVRNDARAQIRPQIFLALLLLVLSWAVLLAAGGLIARSLQRNDTDAMRGPACFNYGCSSRHMLIPVSALPQPAAQEVGAAPVVAADAERLVL